MGLIERALAYLPLPVVVLDRDLRVVVWNKAMEEEFGAGQVGERLGDVLPQFARPIRGTLWCDLIKEQVIGDGHPIMAPRFLLPTRVGEAPFDILASPVKDSGGTVLGAVVLLRNVAGQVAAEERLRIDERTTALTHLAAALAHEIRNPLYAITLSVQLLKEDMESGTPDVEQMRSTLEVLEEEAARLERIIKEFREFARPVRLNIQLHNINELLTRALRSLKQHAQRKRVDVVVEFAPLPDVPVDGDLIVRAFTNIALNAIEALHDGGRLEVITRREGDNAIIVFRDNGRGIPQENLNRIFDLFFSTKKDGTGLGLPIALRIVEAHHGHIRVDSTPDVGTAVSVFLPTKIVSR